MYDATSPLDGRYKLSPIEQNIQENSCENKIYNITIGNRADSNVYIGVLSQRYADKFKFYRKCFHQKFESITSRSLAQKIVDSIDGTKADLIGFVYQSDVVNVGSVDRLELLV